MIPTTRLEFKEFCLQELGDGVLQINMTDAQAENQIDKALYTYQQFHMDAVQKDYMKHQITPSTMVFSAPSTLSFSNGEQLIGLTSNATGVVVAQTNSTSITFYTMSRSFVLGETVRGGTTGAQGTIGPTIGVSIVSGDMDTHYIDIPDAVVSVTRIFPPFDARVSADILFDPTAQFSISLMSNFTNNSIIPYVMGRQYQQLLNDTFRGRPLIRYQRHQNRLFIDMNFVTSFRPYDYLIIECYRVLDPTTYPDVWSDRWLQSYATALIKKQWGTNLKKYNGMQLPGGNTVDGKTIFDEAVQEIKDLEHDLETKFQEPIDFFVG